MKTATFYTYSFGCRVNQAEKEAIDREMQDSGYKMSAKMPSIAIINTCAVTHKAEREAKQLIYRLKRENTGGQLSQDALRPIGKRTICLKNYLLT